MAIQQATPIVLSADERSALEAWARAPTTEQRLAERARIVLAERGDHGHGHLSLGQIADLAAVAAAAAEAE